MSSGSYPAIACSIRATSSTERHIHPTVSSVQLTGTTPCRLILPKLGLNPTTPLYDAGRSTDPTVCDPSAAGHIRAATETADPLLDPPGVQAASHGLNVGDGSMQANSVVIVFPMMIAPASFSRRTEVPSNSGTKSAYTLEQAVVGIPAV